MNFLSLIPRASLIVLSFSIAVGGLSAAGLEDWKLEDVLKRLEEANGGLESIQKVSNVRIIGEIESAEGGYNFSLLKKRPDRFRLGLSSQGRSIDTGYDGITCWKKTDLGTSVTVEELTGEQKTGILVEADFDGPLIGDAPLDSSRRLVRTERIDRVDYFVVEVNGPRGLFHHFVDSRTFREMKVEHYEDGDLGAKPRITIYNDYERFGGIWVSMNVERTMPDGKVENIRIRHVEINPGLLDFIFEMPEQGASEAP
jgi:hypothetical protein